MKKKLMVISMVLVVALALTGCGRGWRRTQDELDAENQARIPQMQAEYILQVALMEADEQATIMRLDAEARLYYDRLNAERVLLAAEAQAQADIVAAQAAAEMQRIHALVTAEYIVMSAEAQAQANRELAASLDDYILRDAWIRSWNGELPQTMLGNDAAIFFGVS